MGGLLSVIDFEVGWGVHTPWIVLIGFSLIFGVSWRGLRKTKRKFSTSQHGTSDIKDNDPKEISEEIIPLPDFDWKSTEPLKFRPFKPIYHLTMGLTRLTISDLIAMDKTYLSRVTLRKEIMRTHPSTVLQARPESTSAVNELYTFLFSIYLPQRFPQIFLLTSTSLYNTATCSSIPLTPSSDPIENLSRIGENIDDEFLILLKAEDGDGYVLKAFVTCFPSGFDTEKKLGLRLREIHAPVPGYKEKLEMSMDRFFDRLEVGRVVSRVNWSITTHDKLFAPYGNHLYADEEAQEEEVDINNTYLRCERQLLHRLPYSKALIFSFKTYLYPISEIKEEGLGEDLATAIDGLKAGSVPQMNVYKKAIVWGEAVQSFLRDTSA